MRSLRGVLLILIRIPIRIPIRSLRRPRRSLRPTRLGLLLLAIGCGPAEAPKAVVRGDFAPPPAGGAATAPDGRRASQSRGRSPVPSRGSDSTLDVASWNIEWFGDPTHAPDNDRQQGDNVRDVILGTDADIWGVAEVVDMGAWTRLKAALPGYDGFLANEGRVTSRASYYSLTEQKVGVLFKRGVATALEAKVILPQYNDEFAGRPPLQVRFRVTVGGRTDELVLIVVHMKASADQGSWSRRSRAAAALQQYVREVWPAARVLVVGDFNDDVDRSVTRGQPSPYARIGEDDAHFRFLTAPLSARNVSSTATFREMIDHHLASRALADVELPNSIEVHRIDRVVPNYRRTTSDHFPVVSHFRWGR